MTHARQICILIVLVVAVAVVTSGCSSKSTNTKISGELRGELASAGSNSPSPGEKYVQVYATVSNLQAKNRMGMGPDNFKLKDAKGNVYETNWFATQSIGGGMKTVDFIQPRESVSGIIIFSIPQNAAPISLEYSDLWGNASFTF